MHSAPSISTGLDKSVVPMCHLIVSINLKYRANVFIENSILPCCNLMSFCHSCVSFFLHQLAHKSSTFFPVTSVWHFSNHSLFFLKWESTQKFCLKAIWFSFFSRTTIFSEKFADCTSTVTINKEWVFEALKTYVAHLKCGEVLWSHKWEKQICYSLNSITELNSRTNVWKNNLVFLNQIKWFIWKDLKNLYFKHFNEYILILWSVSSQKVCCMISDDLQKKVYASLVWHFYCAFPLFLKLQRMNHHLL